MDPAPLIVPLPPALLLPELGALDDAAADELELDLLEPHAATTSDAATSRATARMRLVLNVISFIRCVEGVSADRLLGVLSRCEPMVAAVCALCRHPVAEAEVRVDESPPRKRFLQLHP